MFVRKSLRQALFLFTTAALVLTACTMGATPAPTVDVNAINTAAVATAMGQLSAQFTQTAQAAPTATAMPTNTAQTLSSLPTTSGAQPTTSGALPTVSFNTNTTPVVGNTTPLAGFTPFSTVQPAGGPTAVLGDSCNNASFVADITIPDNEVLKAGTDAQKIWAVKNAGTCTWDEGYKLVQFAGSPGFGPYSYEFKKKSDFVAPGATANLGFWFDVPCTVGKYEAHFRMQSDSGYYFGTVLSMYFEVQEKCK